MDIVRLGKKGQLSLPAGVLRKLGLQGAAARVRAGQPQHRGRRRPGREGPKTPPALKLFLAASARG